MISQFINICYYNYKVFTDKLKGLFAQNNIYFMRPIKKDISLSLPMKKLEFCQFNVFVYERPETQKKKQISTSIFQKYCKKKSF
jgi:hypothetical protein